MCNLAEFGFRRANSYGYNSFCGEGGEYYVSSFSSAFIPILPFLWPLWRPPPLSPPLFSFFTSAFPKLNIIDTHTHTHTLSVSLPRSFLLSYFLPPQSLIYLPRTEQSTAVYWILVISHRKNRQKRSRWSNFRGFRKMRKTLEPLGSNWVFEVQGNSTRSTDLITLSSCKCEA